MTEKYLQIKTLSKSYNKQVLNNVSFETTQGKIVCLLGPSGCGKTTLLRIIAGFESPDSGEVYFKGKNISPIPVHLRNFGMMFQDFALFPHLSVEENIKFGLNFQNKNSSDKELRVNELLQMMDLFTLKKRMIQDLSGGEKQRVALARSLAPEPQLLLLDEPLGALDKSLREQLISELRYILKKYQMTTVMVTHDQQEAMQIADLIIVMQDGQIEQMATPEELYRQPKNLFVASFLGFKNTLLARRLSNCFIETSIGKFTCPFVDLDDTKPRYIILRPDSAEISPKLQSDRCNSSNRVFGKLIGKRFLGRGYQIDVSVESRSDDNSKVDYRVLQFEINDNVPDEGAEIELVINEKKITLIY